ncbi:class F sortase [Streptosporangium sp. NPDC002524]|uniref:class F sortase n=1 Tax=Streptosporangium sp. NPDC002524 TaxID=3154537 RepID=UPI003322FD93
MKVSGALVPLLCAWLLTGGCGNAPADAPAPQTTPATRAVSASPTAPPGGSATTSSSRGTTTPGPVWSAVPGQVAVPPTPSPGARHAEPALVTIPALGVRSDLERLTIGPNGELTPPRAFDRAGWYAAGVRPGNTGPAVIAGHVDSESGPAVFAELGRLRKGDEIHVGRTDGTRVLFEVDAVRTAAKADFPTGDVYGATPDAQLRLITCGGRFDDERGHYTDNVIVFASLKP